MPRSRLLAATAVGAVALLATAGCASSSDSSGGSDDAAKVAILTSKTGPLADYGKQYIEGFKAGLDYATNGTGKVGGRQVEVTTPTTPATRPRRSPRPRTSSARATRSSPGRPRPASPCRSPRSPRRTRCCSSPGRPRPTPHRHQQLHVPLRPPDLPGRPRPPGRSSATPRARRSSSSPRTTPSARPTWPRSRPSSAPRARRGPVAGARRAPPTSPRSRSRSSDAEPDLLFVAWAGDHRHRHVAGAGPAGRARRAPRSSPAWTSRASYPMFGAAGDKISFLSHYFDGAAGQRRRARRCAKRVRRPGGNADLFTPDGFTAAQMIVHAAAGAAATTSTAWSRRWRAGPSTASRATRPSGPRTTRCCSRCSRRKLVGSGAELTPELVKTAADRPGRAAAGRWRADR